MKITIFIVHFMMSLLIFVQNNVSSESNEKDYNYLLNYVPNNLITDTIHDVESRFLKSRLNTIGTLKIFSGLRKEMNLSENDNEWLNKRIEKLANELFNDGKRILIIPVGGYAGCPDELLGYKSIQNEKVIILKFCHTCTDSHRDENFIELFNKKMYALMNIEPPNSMTYRFYGVFKGYKKNNNGIKLIVNDDRTFKYWKNKGHGSDFTQGWWKNDNDTLTLTSKVLSKTDSLNFLLSSASWIEFNKLKFRLKGEKLTRVDDKKTELKRTTE